MRSAVITIISVIILASVGLGIYIYSNSNKSVPQKATGQSQTSTNYIEYSSGVLNKPTDKRRVLFFFASWCPTCIPTDADFKQNMGMIPNDVEIIRINYNDPETDEEEKALAIKHGITYQHTFVQIDANGNAITKWNGGMLEELLGKIK